VDDQEIENVGVYDAVESITAESTDFKHIPRLINANANSDAFVLEESHFSKT